MVAAGRDRLVLLVLSERGSTELAGDDDQRFVQQAALFQVVDQGGDGLVTEPGVERQLDVEPLVVVPRPLDEMHESDAALDQSAGQGAIGGKGAVLIRTPGRSALMTGSSRSTPYASSVRRVSPERSASSGAAVCIRNAS